MARNARRDARSARLAVYTECIYDMDVEFTWSEAKRDSNWAKHGLDFADAELVFTGETFTFEDTRFCYGERRYITLGLLHRNSRLHRPHRTCRRNPHHLVPQSNAPRSRNLLRRSRALTGISCIPSEPGTPTPEHPEADLRYIVRGVVRRGLVPVPPKTSIALRVDSRRARVVQGAGPAATRRA